MQFVFFQSKASFYKLCDYIVKVLLFCEHVRLLNVRRMKLISGGNMKTMNCKQLGGACDKKFHANTFEEIAELSKQHGMEMFQKNDEAHLKAMSEMQALMQNPEAMKAWFDNKKKEFEALPED